MSNALTKAARPLAMQPAEKAVLMALADMARDPDDRQSPAQCWPPMHGQGGALGLCDWTCLSERTVQRALSVLEAAGHVTRRRLSHGQRYSVHPGGPSPVTTTGQTSPATVTGQPVAVSPVTVTPSPVTLSPSPVTVTGKASRSTTKHKKASPSKDRASLFASLAAGHGLPPLPSSARSDQWADYSSMRADMTRGAKPKPWTASVARKARERLIALAATGANAGAVLDASVLNGWQGLFKPKDDQDGQRGSQLGGGGASRPFRGRTVDGFAAVLRDVATRGRADDTGGS